MLSSMKSALGISLGVLVSALAFGCGSSSNSSQTYAKGRVEVYEKFIIVTDPEGIHSLYPNGYWSDLQFRSE